MNKRLLILLIGALLSLGLVACGDDSGMDNSGTEQPAPDIPDDPEPEDPEPEEPEDPEEPEPEPLRVTIIGDSYSTFNGYSNVDIAGNPNGFSNMYPYADMDVLKMEDTWWGRLCATDEFDLEVNNSYAGSTICNSSYNNRDVSNTDLSFIHRVGRNSKGVDYNGNPDIILIFGGTNDAWGNVRMGKYIYSGWSYYDLLCFRAGFAKLITLLKQHYPKAKIYNISNVHKYDGKPGITKRVATSMAYVCKHFDVPNIQLNLSTTPDMQYDHPTATGMKHIFEQVYAVLTGKAEPTPAPAGEPEQPTLATLDGDPIEYTPTRKRYVNYADGMTVSLNDATWWTTNFIPIPEGATHVSVSPITVYNKNNIQTCPIAFYDSASKYIKEGSAAPCSQGEYATDLMNFPIPENAAYVRFSWTDFPFYHITTHTLVELCGEINPVWITK